MPNLVTNATGLDGVTGWSGAGVAVDGVVLGAPNRLVIVATDTLSEPAGYRPAVAPGETVYVSGLFIGGALSVRFYNAAAGTISTTPLPTTRAGRGSPTRGIASTFNFARGSVAAPALTASAGLVVTTGGGDVAAVLRPSLAVSGATCWRPGPHLNPDLDLPPWPDGLPMPQASGFELEPIPLRKSFAADGGIPTSRLTSATSRRFATCELVLDAIGRDLLDQFWRDNHAEFWFVRPDNGDLCIAEWADDGDPRDSGTVPTGRRTTFKLLLRDS